MARVWAHPLSPTRSTPHHPSTRSQDASLWAPRHRCSPSLLSYPRLLSLFSPVASASDYQIHHDAHPSSLSSTLRLASRRTPTPKANPQPQRPPHSASDHEGGRSCCCDPGRCAGVMARRWMRVLVATLVFAGTGEPFCYNRFWFCYYWCFVHLCYIHLHDIGVFSVDFFATTML